MDTYMAADLPFPGKPGRAGNVRRQQDDPVPVPQRHRLLECVLQQHRHLAHTLRYPAPETTSESFVRRISAAIYRALRDGTGWHRGSEAAPGRKRHGLPFHDCRKGAAYMRIARPPAVITRWRCCPCAGRTNIPTSVPMPGEGRSLPGTQRTQRADYRRVPQRTGRGGIR